MELIEEEQFRVAHGNSCDDTCSSKSGLDLSFLSEQLEKVSKIKIKG
jgi:hypothetical protein